MVAFVALVVGYVMGAKAGSKDLDQVVGSLKRLAESEEFADVVSAVAVPRRPHHARARCDGRRSRPSPREETGDLVDRVRHLFVREG